MIEDQTKKRIESEHGMPWRRLMYHLYVEEEMSAGEIADTLSDGEPGDDEYVGRTTVKDWLQQAGVKMRERTLSDIQRVLILAYVDAGYGHGSIADRVDCGYHTARRYKKAIQSGDPPDLQRRLNAADYDTLVGIASDIANN